MVCTAAGVLAAPLLARGPSHSTVMLHICLLTALSVMQHRQCHWQHRAAQEAKVALSTGERSCTRAKVVHLCTCSAAMHHAAFVHLGSTCSTNGGAQHDTLLLSTSCAACPGSEGVGKAVAASLASNGLHIIMVSRSKTKLDAAASEIKVHFPLTQVSLPVP